MRRHSFLFSVYPTIWTTVWCLLLGAAKAETEPCPCLQSPCEEDSEGASWIFEPSYFSHDPNTGQRVAQYAPLPKVYLTIDPTYQESGFRYTQQFLRGAGSSFDALHIVQTWGQGDQIRPYGEWEYPYREGATPYGPWGNPQGPWTLPFDSWQNPYGLGQLPYYSGPIYPNNQMPVPYGKTYSPARPGTGPGSMPRPGAMSSPPQIPQGNYAHPQGGSGNNFGNGSDEEDTFDY